mgnify:CR=1 FL=1
MAPKTYNEKALTFYEDGLTILKEIKSNTDTIMLRQDQAISMQDETLKQSKITNVYLESMTDTRITEEDIT